MAAEQRLDFGSRSVVARIVDHDHLLQRAGRNRLNSLLDQGPDIAGLVEDGYDDGDTHWRKSTKSALGAGNSQIAPFSSKLFICTHKIVQRASTTLNHRFEPDLASTD